VVRSAGNRHLRNAGCVITVRRYTLISMQPWREFLLPNAAFPIRAHNLPGVRLGSLRLVSASRLLKAANPLVPVGDAVQIVIDGN